MDYKERIAEEADRLFKENGIRAVTMDLIASELGMSKRTIYEHFEDKNELLMHVMINHAQNQKAAFFSLMGECDNVIEVIFRIVETAFRQIGNTNPLFMKDLKKYHHDVFLRLCERGDIRNSELSMELLKRGVEEGLFRGEINIELVNEGIQGVIDSTHARQTVQNPKYSKYEVIDNLLFNFLRGISTDKGLKLIIENRNRIIN